MIMYVNGDSHTLGVGITKEQTFAHCVAQHFGFEYINDAKGGGSNDRILRLTNSYLDNNRPDFLLIGWSSWEREEWLHEGRYYDVNSSGHDTLPTGLQQRYKEWMAAGQSKNEDIQDKMRGQHDCIFQLHQRLQYEPESNPKFALIELNRAKTHNCNDKQLKNDSKLLGIIKLKNMKTI
jgi:hypothetical protein